MDYCLSKVFSIIPVLQLTVFIKLPKLSGIKLFYFIIFMDPVHQEFVQGAGDDGLSLLHDLFEPQMVGVKWPEKGQP